MAKADPSRAVLLQALALVLKVAPRSTWICVALLLLEAALGLLSLYLIKLLVDALAAMATANVAQESFEEARFILLLTAAAAIAYLVVRTLAGLSAEIYAQLIGDRIDEILNDHALKLDLEYYESPEYYDVLSRALIGGASPSRTILSMVHLLQNGLMLCALIGLLFSVHWMLAPILAVALIPGVLIRFYFARVQYRWSWGRTQLNRAISYARWLMTDKNHAKELRVFGLGDLFARWFSTSRARLREEKRRIGLRKSAAEGILGTLVTVAFFVALGFLAQRASVGTSSVGDVMMFLVIFQRGQGMLQGLKGNLASLYEDRLYLGNVFEFLALESRMKDPDAPLEMPKGPADFAFEGVSFRYPGCSELVLDEVSLRVPSGKVVALVGVNGSGKTTLIKLLCRLYDPSSGTVHFGDRDVRELRLDDYRRAISVIFQDYAHYYVSARENIRFGDVDLAADNPRIHEAAKASGALEVIEGLPKGYDTIMGRVLEEGAEISLGQWQKIALARALIGQTRLVVLDEPSSALDPGAEFELFKNFSRIIGGRSALIISHRLSTVRQADYIYVLDGGRITEEGDHEALMARGGRYCELFQKQAAFYQT